MYGIGTEVTTPHGKGIVIDHELWSGNGCSRYVIELDSNPFFYSPVCYFFKEVKKEEV